MVMKYGINIIFKISKDISPFFEPLILLFWTSSYVSSGFKARMGSLIHAWWSVCVTHSLRLISVTPAAFLAGSMVAEPFSSTYPWASIGGDQNWDLSCCCLSVRPDVLLTKLCHSSVQISPESQERGKIAITWEKSVYSAKWLTIWHRDVSS